MIDGANKHSHNLNVVNLSLSCDSVRCKNVVPLRGIPTIKTGFKILIFLNDGKII